MAIGIQLMKSVTTLLLYHSPCQSWRIGLVYQKKHHFSCLTPSKILFFLVKLIPEKLGGAHL